MNKGMVTTLFIFVVFLATTITIPVIKNVPNHPDEHQFYANAFSILRGEPLHNYLHVAATEYSLAAFFNIINMFTDAGVNFPQGEPTEATYYFGHIFGFLLYIVTFTLGVLVLQKKQKSIRLRTLIFSVLYFGSLGIFERFIRVNSDSFIIFIFMNFLLFSLWMHEEKATTTRFFILNLIFLFLATFSNLKSLYLFLPLLSLNLVLSVVYYKDKMLHTFNTLYLALLNMAGLIFGTVYLWQVFAPRPFDSFRFWYGIKKTVIHGTKFDFDYPSQAYNSFAVYLYDYIFEYLGIALATLVSVAIVYLIATKQKTVFTSFFTKISHQLKVGQLKGNLYRYTEIILVVTWLTYYLGISMRVIHWSRWGVPLGFIGLLLISIFLEHIYYNISLLNKLSTKRALKYFAVFLAFMWFQRLILVYDLKQSGHMEKIGTYYQTNQDIAKFMAQNNIVEADAFKKIMWFTGYTSNVSGGSLETVVNDDKQDIEYILWPYWNIGVVYTNKTVDKEVHNQRAFIDKYTESVEYRFPTLTAYYMHYTKYFAWNVLGISWNPEIDSLVEPQYAILKLKKPVKDVRLSYSLEGDALAKYFSPYSQTFNMKTLTDSYAFPPCHSYPDVMEVATGKFVTPPPEIGIGARTADLYCHSVRFRVYPKGSYRIRIEGLPNDTRDSQKVYYSLGPFKWDPNTNTATLYNPETRITAEFGVATKEKNIRNLKMQVFYVLNAE